MTDRVSPMDRSAIMKRIKSKGTALESRTQQILRISAKQKCTRHDSKLPGRPDFVFYARRIVVFVDSCFFHNCSAHVRLPKSNRAYWQQKLERNEERDHDQRKALRKAGWRVVRIWEHELKNPTRLASKLKRVFAPNG